MFEYMAIRLKKLQAKPKQKNAKLYFKSVPRE